MTTIADILARLPELSRTLDDLNVLHVTIAPSGIWSFEKLGRVRSGGGRLDGTELARLADRVAPSSPTLHDDWAIRRLDGVSGPTLLLERLPVAIADRLPQKILATLKGEVRQSGAGALIGPPGCGKAALMLWLALQVPDEPAIFVSENPPSEFPGEHISHVYPPSNIGERRTLERLARLAGTVFWDRVSGVEDLEVLFGFPGARRRWFSLDAASPRSALRRLRGATNVGCDVRLTTVLALGKSVIGRPEPKHLVVRSADGWAETFSGDAECAELLKAFDTAESGVLRTTELSVPGFILPPSTVHLADDFVDEAVENDAPIVSQSQRPAAASDSSPADAPPATFASDSPLTVEVAERADDAVTGMLMNHELDELREQQMKAEEGNPHKRLTVGARKSQDGMVPEVTKAYTETPHELIPGINDAVTPVAKVAPDLGGGEASEVDLPDDSSPSVEVQFDVYEDVEYDDSEVEDDYSGVLDPGLDFASLAEEMLSELSEVEPLEDHGSTDPSKPVLLSASDIEAIDSQELADLEIEDLEPLDPDDSFAETVASSGDLARLAGITRTTGTPDQESTKEFEQRNRLSRLPKNRGDS